MAGNAHSYLPAMGTDRLLRPYDPLTLIATLETEQAGLLAAPSPPRSTPRAGQRARLAHHPRAEGLPLLVIAVFRLSFNSPRWLA